MFNQDGSKLMFYLMNVSEDLWIKHYTSCTLIFPDIIMRELRFTNHQFEQSFHNLLKKDYIFQIDDAEIGTVYMFNSAKIWAEHYSISIN